VEAQNTTRSGQVRGKKTFATAFVFFAVCISFADPKTGPKSDFSFDSMAAKLGSRKIEQGKHYGVATVRYTGFGKTQVMTYGGRPCLLLVTKPSTRPDETHANLVLLPWFSGGVDLSCNMTTLRQLRRNSPAQPHEAAWIIWNYVDDAHFYYLILKENGAELGKEDPAYSGNQRFIPIYDTANYNIGTTYSIHIQQFRNHIQIWVDGRQIADFTDSERPIESGRVAAYCEDSKVIFQSLKAKTYKGP